MLPARRHPRTKGRYSQEVAGRALAGNTSRSAMQQDKTHRAGCGPAAGGWPPHALARKARPGGHSVAKQTRATRQASGGLVAGHRKRPQSGISNPAIAPHLPRQRP